MQTLENYVQGRWQAGTGTLATLVNPTTGRILVECVSRALFPTLDAAVLALHPTATRQKRARLRACATVVEELEGQITTPERLTVRQVERLASALRGGFTDLIQHILEENRGKSLNSQWSALLQT